MSRQLFYPIHEDQALSVFFSTSPIPNCCVKKKDFSKVVLVEMFQEDITEEDVWEKLQISEDLVSEKRIIINTHRIPGLRALITYRSADEAKAAVSKYHRTADFDTCATLVNDLLSSISEMEVKIKLASIFPVQNQVVFVDSFTEEPNPTVFENLLTKMFVSISTSFSMCVNLDEKGIATGEALVNFSYLSDALSAELAFNDVIVNGHDISVTLLRDVALVQHDLKVRVSMLGQPEESFSSVEKMYPETIEVNSKSLGCSNINCNFCYSKFPESESDVEVISEFPESESDVKAISESPESESDMEVILESPE